MSLTTLLDERDGPVRRFFEETFPDLGVVRRLWREAGSPRLRPADPSPTYPWGQVAAALDYRIRFSLGPVDLAASVSAAGAALLRRSSVWQAHVEPPQRDAFEHLIGAVGELIDREPVSASALKRFDRRLCGFCYVLALYEACFRTGIVATSPLASLRPDASVDEQVALANEDWIDDLCVLSKAFRDSHVGHEARSVVMNPTFAGSRDVGGADADIIIDRCLLEIKTTIRPSPRREWIQQLIGYALLDYEDAHAIERVGFYVSRIPALLTWDLDDLLSELAGRTVRARELRAAFREVVTTSRRVE